MCCFFVTCTTQIISDTSNRWNNYGSTKSNVARTLESQNYENPLSVEDFKKLHENPVTEKVSFDIKSGGMTYSIQRVPAYTFSDPRYYTIMLRNDYYEIVTTEPQKSELFFVQYPKVKRIRCPDMSENAYYECKGAPSSIIIGSTKTFVNFFGKKYPIDTVKKRWIKINVFFEQTDSTGKGIRKGSWLTRYVEYPECLTYFTDNGLFKFEVTPYETFFNITCVLPTTQSKPNYACPPGQWLTCRSQESCTYIEYLNSWDYNNEQNIFRYQNYPGHVNIPVGHCYPCVDGVNKYHYNNIKVPSCEISPALTGADVCRSYVPSKDVDKIYCLGFRAPPQKCPVNTVANSDRTGCVCVPGYYKADSDCLPCPVGYFCINGIKTVCGIDTYQSLTGQSACLDCVDSNGYSMKDCPVGRNLAPARCQPKVVGGVTDVTYVKTIQCVPCSTCRNNIISKYIDSSVLNDYIECYI
jgi:hypothetical protein